VLNRLALTDAEGGEAEMGVERGCKIGTVHRFWQFVRSRLRHNQSSFRMWLT
jgi:hypothetical protein